MSITVCIPTYKRPHLLHLLIEDIGRQSLQPNHLIVVDGDQASGTARAMLSNIDIGLPMTYVPSNHGNLAYQRYLGWRAADEIGTAILIYFDDDQRILQSDVLNWLCKPMLARDRSVVGVGCFSKVPASGHSPAMDHLMKRASTPMLVRLMGSSSTLKLKAGQLTPTGHRVALVDNGQDYVETTWLQGRIMAYSMSAISEDTFSEDLFALDHVRCGLGEDTFLSRRVGAKGKLLYTFRAVVDHPNADTPKSYPYEAYRYAYAAAYSRRFQNDYYRVYEPPTRADRFALVKSYAGTTLLAWMRAVTKPSKLHFALARGTTLGALHGLTRPPTAKRLTPHINWRADADEALKNAQVINNGSR